MAKFTIELGSMVAAHKHLMDIQHNADSVSFKDDDYDFIYHSFDYRDTDTPNNIVEEAGVDFFNRHIGNIPSNYTDNAEINSQIDAQLKKTFLRHFYGWEIGQENPEYWFLIARDFFDEYMPIFVKSWQQLVVDNSQWITNLNHTTGHYTGTVTGVGNGTSTTDNNNDTKALTGVADTPQNGLDFRIDNEEENPTAGYNFRYSSNVTGSHGHDKGHATSVTNTKDTQDSENDSTQDSQGRNQTIASLINELDAFTNGAYQNLFTNAKSYGLFMQVF